MGLAIVTVGDVHHYSWGWPPLQLGMATITIGDSQHYTWGWTLTPNMKFKLGMATLAVGDGHHNSWGWLLLQLGLRRGGEEEEAA